MLLLPPAAEPLIAPFAAAFSRPTYARFLTLLVGVIVTNGRRTVSHILRVVAALAPGHACSYHRFFSRARWSLWPLGRVLAAAVLAILPADQPVHLAADDTVAQHRGRKVYGKGCHRDAVRSSWGKLIYKWGHRWVVLAVLVKFPFAKRPWALPVLCALYRPPEMSRREKRRHKVPSDLARQLVAALLRWFPQKRFILLGDGHFSGIVLADFARRRCRRQAHRLTVIGRLRADAALYAKPSKASRRQRGRRQIKGRKLRHPGEQVKHARRRRLKVRWYGNSRRRVHVVAGKGIWYRCGTYAQIAWTCVYDPVGRRTNYFYSTDPRMSPRRIIETFASRWSIEVTFQEVRALLGWETTCQRAKLSVLRTAPLLMGCFSVVSLIYARLSGVGRTPVSLTKTSGSKTPADVHFSQALTAVRRLLWQKTILDQALSPAVVAKCPLRFKRFLLEQLSAAA